MNSADQALLRSISQGDKHAFSLLYDRYWESLFLYVAKVIKNRDDAGDIVQELFVSVWQRRETLEKVGSLSSYLFAAARYKGISYIQSNIHKNDYLDSLISFFSQATEPADKQVEADELELFIKQEIEKLPPKMRTVFLLSRNENLSYKEIAEKLQISDKTVKKQINTALKQLRLKLKEHYPTGMLLLAILKSL